VLKQSLQKTPVERLAPLKASAEAEKLRMAMTAAGAVAFNWTLADDVIEWEGAFEILPRQSDPDQLCRGRDFLTLMHPESRALLMNFIEGAGAVGGAPFRIEVELASALGSIWYALSAVCIFGHDGTPERVTGMISDITEARRQSQRLTYLATRDELTGHLNRNSLRAALSEAIAKSKTDKRHCAFLVVSIDRLAMINATYGFDAADEVIVAVGERLVRVLRSSDVVGRMAGNKFGVLLHNCADYEVPTVGERLRGAVRNSLIETRAGQVAATASSGAVWLPAGASTSQEAMLRAEEALTRARSHGRDNFYLYEPSPQNESARQSLMATADEVLRALKEHRLIFAYQPIFDAKTRKITEYECLIRLRRKDGSIAAAGAFVPAAEQLGLVRLIDWHALEMVVEILETTPNIKLGVNVSGTTSRDAVWLQSFVDYVRAHGQIANRLVVELTETAALNHFEENARFVSQLRELGCRLAIDDFGAGYTSFRNLQKLRVDMVKIDGSYVEGLAKSPQNQLFVRTLVDLAKSFDLVTVAEWVGSEDEAKMLEGFGVDRLQGFFLGKPELEPAWNQNPGI
jgi:diguanylate cyclase (GGDEF)-like protein